MARAHKQPLAGIRYVNAAAVGNNTRTSWCHAYVNLQDALVAVTEGQIWVAKGNYWPGETGEQHATFQLASGVELYGGFKGSGKCLARRDASSNVTILNGDIDQNDTYGGGPNWWQFGWTGGAGNSFHVVTGSGADASAVSDGFTIQAGVAADPLNHRGGGLYVDGGSPSIRNCTFRYCAAGF